MDWGSFSHESRDERRMRDLLVLLVVFGVTFATFGLVSMIG